MLPPPEWWRAACSRRPDISTRPAFSPRTDRRRGSCARRRGSSPCRTADRRSAVSFILATTARPSAVAFERLDRFQIVDDRRVDAGGHHAREFARPLRATCQRLVKARLASVMSQYQVAVRTRPCAVFKPQRLDVVDEDQQAGELLPALAMPNSAPLLDGVDRCRRRHWRAR